MPCTYAHCIYSAMCSHTAPPTPNNTTLARCIKPLTHTQTAHTHACLSVGDVQEVMDACAASPDCYVSMDWDARLMYAAVYHLFGLLWTSQFIIGFVSVTIAGAVASHYWAAGDARRRPPFPVLRALRLTVVYHLGSIALGSFIIALVQLVRLLLEYLDKKTRAAQAKSEAARCAMCAARVVLCLLEKVVAFINRNAYIMVAGAEWHVHEHQAPCLPSHKHVCLCASCQDYTWQPAAQPLAL
jgi:Plasma-membrane choline transporter